MANPPVATVEGWAVDGDGGAYSPCCDTWRILDGRLETPGDVECVPLPVLAAMLRAVGWTVTPP